MNSALHALARLVPREVVDCTTTTATAENGGDGALVNGNDPNNNNNNNDANTCYVPFWYSRTGTIIKWAIFLGLLVLLALYLVLGYTHAKRRIRKGLRPLAYHRWLVPRSELARIDPRYAYPAPQPAGLNPYNANAAGANNNNNNTGDYYGMYPVPPPVYDPNAARPPVYEPEGGAGKIDPAQAGHSARAAVPNREADPEAQTETYEPPAGPPPPQAMRSQGTGGSNPFRG